MRYSKHHFKRKARVRDGLLGEGCSLRQDTKMEMMRTAIRRGFLPMYFIKTWPILSLRVKHRTAINVIPAIS